MIEDTCNFFTISEDYGSTMNSGDETVEWLLKYVKDLIIDGINEAIIVYDGYDQVLLIEKPEIISLEKLKNSLKKI